MFEHMQAFKKIIVTGPQRSGTTITAKMIAADTGHDYIDEDDIGIKSMERMRAVIKNDRRVVVHCPALCRHVHEFGGRDDTAVVIVRRPIPDIVASQKRIGWPAEKEELGRYGIESGIISKVKYRYWDNHQKANIKHPVEVTYASLKKHPLWVPKQKRVGWGPRQTGAA